jgi:hypothetical protein
MHYHPSEFRAPRPLLAWRFLPILVAACLALVALSGCVTPDGDFDAPATAQELALTSIDLESLAVVAEIKGKDSTAKALRDASVALDAAADALESGQPVGDAWGTIDAALDVLDALAAKEQDGDLALGVAAARIVVRRIKASVPTD